METAKKMTKTVLSNLVLLVIIIISIFPFVYMFLMSFKSTINAYDFDFSLDKLSLAQYEKIFAMEDFGRYVFNSVFVAVAGVILTLVVCSLAGYAFAKLDFKGNDKIFLFLVLTMIVPSEVIIVPLFLLTKGLGRLNSYQALILPLPTAFGIFIMRQSIMDVPKDLMDAAKLDGCSNFKIYRKVVLPLITSPLLALAIFTFVGAWNNFLWPLVACTKQEMKTLPLALSMMKKQFNTDVGMTMACAVINFLPPFIFYLFMQNRFKEGITISGMKG